MDSETLAILIGVVVALAVLAVAWLAWRGAAARGAAAPSGSVVGTWKEYWGIPGQTDVTYHDEYRVRMGGDGRIRVEILNRNQQIEGERFEQGQLTFVQRTDVFLVHYVLRLEPGGRWLVGTATTPEKVVPVKWERIG